MDVVSFTGTKVRINGTTGTVFEVLIKEFPIYFTDTTSTGTDLSFKIGNFWDDGSGTALGDVKYKYVYNAIRWQDLPL